MSHPWRLLAGNLAYARTFGSDGTAADSDGSHTPPLLDLKMLRVVNDPDIVPKVTC